MVKINSRMSEKRNDVLNDKRFRDAMYPLLMQLEDSKISVNELQYSFLKILKKQKSDEYFWNERCNYCLEKKEDYIFWREDFGGKDVTVSLLFLEPGEVHPPHHHNNVISVQSVVSGKIWAREYQRVECLSEDEIIISPALERLMTVDDEIIAHEWSRNVHWFAATKDEPAVMWNCNVRGFQTNLFLNPPPNSLGRILIDPHCAVVDGRLLAKKLSVKDAYAKFGDKPLSNWPIPENLIWIEDA